MNAITIESIRDADNMEIDAFNLLRLYQLNNEQKLARGRIFQVSTEPVLDKRDDKSITALVGSH